MKIISGLLKWALENPQNTAVTIATLLAGGKGVSKVVKSVGRCMAKKQEQYNKERYVYDHSLGIYLKTKRNLIWT